MEAATYPVAVSALQDALGRSDDSLVMHTVAQCLKCMEMAAYPILSGGVYLMAGHYFLRRKQYAEARMLYQQGGEVYGNAQLMAIPGADWLRVQAMLCEAQTYYRANKHPQALQVWQTTHRYAITLPDLSPLSIEVAIRLAEAYHRDGRRRQAVVHYEEALTLAEMLPQPLRPMPLLSILYRSYLPFLDLTPDRRRLQLRIDSLIGQSVG